VVIEYKNNAMILVFSIPVLVQNWKFDDLKQQKYAKIGNPFTWILQTNGE